jgi:hypothetical protein
MKTPEDEEMKKQRSEFVNELFNFKSEFERKSNSLKEDVRTEAYVKLGHIFDGFRAKMIKIEKQRLTRERVFYN